MQATETITSVVPAWMTAGAKAARRRVLAFANRGNAVECPVCGGTFSGFLSYHRRTGAQCPGCEALERHRMLWLYFQTQTNLLTDRLRVLHFAPELALEQRLRAQPGLDYVTADLLRTDVDLTLDVTRLELDDESFDVLICSHVLEHVTDDRLAMRELLRVTCPGGWAILTTPVRADRTETYEDWSITDPAGRLQHFGQADHVRQYGTNFPELLRAEGWQVEVTPMPLTDEQAARWGIPEAEQDIYVGRREADAGPRRAGTA